ncbi:hypothetical protein Btru_033179 [Bulinus truncatus]|nr:hypothetical protein Btru_033179 [Bulinus truncatus]
MTLYYNVAFFNIFVFGLKTKIVYYLPAGIKEGLSTSSSFKSTSIITRCLLSSTNLSSQLASMSRQKHRASSPVTIVSSTSDYLDADLSADSTDAAGGTDKHSDIAKKITITPPEVTSDKTDDMNKSTVAEAKLSDGNDRAVNDTRSEKSELNVNSPEAGHRKDMSMPTTRETGDMGDNLFEVKSSGLEIQNTQTTYNKQHSSTDRFKVGPIHMTPKINNEIDHSASDEFQTGLLINKEPKQQYEHACKAKLELQSANKTLWRKPAEVRSSMKMETVSSFLVPIYVQTSFDEDEIRCLRQSAAINVPTNDLTIASRFPNTEVPAHSSGYTAKSLPNHSSSIMPSCEGNYNDDPITSNSFLDVYHQDSSNYTSKGPPKVTLKRRLDFDQVTATAYSDFSLNFSKKLREDGTVLNNSLASSHPRYTKNDVSQTRDVNEQDKGLRDINEQDKGLRDIKTGWALSTSDDEMDNSTTREELCPLNYRGRPQAHAYPANTFDNHLSTGQVPCKRLELKTTDYNHNAVLQSAKPGQFLTNSTDPNREQIVVEKVTLPEPIDLSRTSFTYSLTGKNNQFLSSNDSYVKGGLQNTFNQDISQRELVQLQTVARQSYKLLPLKTLSRQIRSEDTVNFNSIPDSETNYNNTAWQSHAHQTLNRSQTTNAVYHEPVDMSTKSTGHFNAFRTRAESSSSDSSYTSVGSQRYQVRPEDVEDDVWRPW